MRITLNISSNTEPVPFDYQQKLVGTIHKWIGENDIHDKLSLYSFSWLKGGTKAGNALTFPKGTSFFISFHDSDIMRRIILSIRNFPEMFCGMYVTDIIIENEPDLSARTEFYCGSPVFIKRKLETGEIKQYVYDDEQTGMLMKETLVSKMRSAGLEEDPTLDIRFDTSFAGKKTKLIRYHGISNRASMCPIIINGRPETKLFAWNVGIGNCTGIGFGSIY